MPIGIGEFAEDGFWMSSWTGTGFIPTDEILVSCAHCLPLDKELAVLFSNEDDEPVCYRLADVSHDPVPDLGCARVDLKAAIPMVIGAHAGSGLDVFATGYPLTNPTRDPLTDERRWEFSPRVMRGYVTRSFIHSDHTHEGIKYPPQPSLELDMRVPTGLSGAALLIPAAPGVNWQLVGVVYGQHDSYTIAEEWHLDPDTGESTSPPRPHPVHTSPASCGDAP